MHPVGLVCHQSPLPSQLQKLGFDFGILSATRLAFALGGPGAVIFRSGDHVSPLGTAGPRVCAAKTLYSSSAARPSFQFQSRWELPSACWDCSIFLTRSERRSVSGCEISYCRLICRPIDAWTSVTRAAFSRDNEARFLRMAFPDYNMKKCSILNTVLY
jgi:hypothetical protein